MLKLATSLLVALVLALPSRARAEDASPRVVYLDAVVLPPALENTDIRRKVIEAISESALAHGWKPVWIPTECTDLGCAGAVARSARALYVLMLTGRFAANDTYATDVGVVLWRDGVVIASRSEEDEEAEARASGGKVMRCGPPDGACTKQLFASKLEQYALRVLEAEAAASRAREAAAAAAAAPPAPVQPPPPLVPVTPPEEHTGRRALAWSLVGGGVVVGAGAIALWALNGSKVQCNAVPADTDDCRAERRTGTAALVAGGLGVAAAAAGVVLLVVDRRSGRLALSVHPSGVSVGGTF
jgi:hypothetical protein